MENKKELKSVAIIGLGYVGLPLAIRSAERGYKVYGVDLDARKIELIKKGQSPFKEEFIEERKTLLSKITVSTDPYYLIEKAKESGFDHKFLRTAREINNSMPVYTVEIMQDALNEIGLPMKDTVIGVMGLSYKANVDDLRESPAIKIISELKKKKAKIIRFDPFIKSMSDVPNLAVFLKKCQAIILVTNHNEFANLDPVIFKKNNIRAIVDGMNCMDKEKIKKLGIKYRGIGRR